MDSSNISPFIYQDLMSGNQGMMPYVGNPFMGGMYPTNLLGRVTFSPQPDSDKFMRMQERNEKEKSVFLRSMAALLVIGGSAALLFKGKIKFSSFMKKTGGAIASPIKKFGAKAKNGTKAISSGIVDTSQKAGKTAKSGLKKLGHAIVSPFKWIKNKIKKTT